MPIASSDAQAHAVGIIEHWMATGALLPSQISSASTWSPEARLAGAVLEQTLTEIRDHTHKPHYRRRIVQDLEWIGSNDTSWPYSFLRLCELLGLEPEYVRRRVMRWVQSVPFSTAAPVVGASARRLSAADVPPVVAANGEVSVHSQHHFTTDHLSRGGSNERQATGTAR